jgi:hypothetical protein
MPGIRSYNHLNEVILQILKDNNRAMTAPEIYNIIVRDYSVNKIRINPLKVAKRIRYFDNIEYSKGEKGLMLYRYNI